MCSASDVSVLHSFCLFCFLFLLSDCCLILFSCIPLFAILFHSVFCFLLSGVAVKVVNYYKRLTLWSNSVNEWSYLYLCLYLLLVFPSANFMNPGWPQNQEITKKSCPERDLNSCSLDWQMIVLTNLLPHLTFRMILES